MSEMMNNVTEIDASEAAYDAAKKVLSDAAAQAWVRVGEANYAEKLAMDEAKKAWAVYQTLVELHIDLVDKKAALDKAKTPQQIEAVVPAVVTDEDDIMVCYAIEKEKVSHLIAKIESNIVGDEDAERQLLTEIGKCRRTIGVVKAGSFTGELIT